MSDEDSPEEGPVTDPQELERVMLLALKDPGLMGPLMRMLLEARLWAYVPPHPELVGHSRDQTEPFTWQEYEDAEGRFAPVFLTAQRAVPVITQAPSGLRLSPARSHRASHVRR